MSLELAFKSAEINLPQEIENLEALKAELTPKLEMYNNLVVTEDSIKAAKNDKAALNKLRKAIEDQRIAIKKQYLEPYNILEAQCKEVVNLIDAPIQAIDKQIKVFEEAEKQEKYTQLAQAFTALNPPDWIQIEDVLNPKWENKTAKLDALKAEMTASYNKLIEDFEKISSMYADFPHKLAIESKYKECKDFSKAAVYAAELNTAYRREQELKEQMLKAAAEEQARLAQNAQNAQEQPEAVSNESVLPEVQAVDSVESGKSEKPKMIIGRFEVAGTAEQIKALGAFMKSNGIRFSIIKD